MKDEEPPNEILKGTQEAYRRKIGAEARLAAGSRKSYRFQQTFETRGTETKEPLLCERVE
jgi:hypothetical protein